MLNIEKNDILVLSGGWPNGLDDASKTAETKYSVNNNKSRKKLVWVYTTMQPMFFYANGLKLQLFKAKDLDKNHILCIWEIFQKIS